MTQPANCYLVRALLVLLGFLVLAPRPLWAQQQPAATCTDWTSILGWSGRITVTGSGSYPDQDGGTITISETATINFTTTQSPGATGCDPATLPNTSFSWGALGSQATYSVTVHDKDSMAFCGVFSGVTNFEPLNVDVTNGIAGAAGSASITMNFSNQSTGTYLVDFAEWVDGLVFSSPGNGGDCPGGSSTSSQPWGPGRSGPTFTTVPNAIPLPSSVGPLSGSATFSAPSAVGLAGQTGSGATWTISWSFTPVLDADVVVTIPSYDTWRPTAGKSETEVVGDILTVQAQLVQKSTGQPAVGVIPDKWSFSLVDFSTEPGVAMNWPSVTDRANPSPPDLTFNKQINSAINPNLTISNQDTLAEILNPSQTSSPQNAQVILVPFDWGGWATLNVTATVFGTPIKGHLQLATGQNVTDILLPKRQPGSHIADAWKNQNNVALSTPDSDDSEPSPDGLPGCVGDGLTLYEEYRGFMENGKHIEGDPNKKDFFIQNLVGGDAEPGIALFTRLTQLNVHKDIQKSEMDGFHTPPPTSGTRLINFNHSQGAHEVDQHGVYIRTCNRPDGGPLVGDKTFFSVAGVHGRPGITTEVCLQPRDAAGNLSLNSLDSHGGSITAEDAFVQYDIGVAHELLHSVGVDHHGDGDPQTTTFQFLRPDDPRNTTGQPLLQLNGQNVRLLTEQEQDLVPSFWKYFQSIQTNCQNIVANPSTFPEWKVLVCTEVLKAINDSFPYIFKDIFYTTHFYIGNAHAEHSGNDQCVMRYFFANVYPSVYPSVGDHVFYAVTPGTEPVGTTLCNSPAGTGVNEPNRNLPKDHPQPRYFDAPRGDCQHQICVNDKNPPAKD